MSMNTKVGYLLISTIVLLVPFLGCQPASLNPSIPAAINGSGLPTQNILLTNGTQPTGYTMANKQRQTSPQVDNADLKTLASDNNSFAIDLFHALADYNNQNLIYAPFSISEALAMTYAGAEGKTAQQMAQVLHYSLPGDRLHMAFNATDLSLQSSTSNQGQDQFQLNIANSLWGQKGFSFLADYLDLLTQNYGTGVKLTDFKNSPEPSRQEINQWISQQTKNKINDLLAKGTITTNTRLALVNAIYFNGRWNDPFDHNLTHKADFTGLDGSKTTVSMMAATGVSNLKYIHGTNFQAVELPYKENQAVMTVIVPDAGYFNDIKKIISSAWISDCWQQMRLTIVQLSMPKYKFETTLGLSDQLSKMGMADAMNQEAADFSNMDGKKDLFIGAVIHKAMIAVDEDGTEAAAASAIVMQTLGMAGGNVQLTVDRPFIIVIHDVHHNSILFMGQVLDPQ